MGSKLRKDCPMSFWDIILFIFVAYMFFAYLLVLFRVIDDIFRNREASGLVKASCIVLLIIVPIITLLIYLVAHGREMAVRLSQEAQARRASYIKDVAGTKSPAEQVTQAKALLDSGAISQVEFESMKAKALS